MFSFNPIYELYLELTIVLSERREVGLVWCNDVQRHFQQYVSYIMAVNFIGGGNWSARRKSQTCCKSLTNIIT
jgi:hypothetical protein